MSDMGSPVFDIQAKIATAILKILEKLISGSVGAFSVEKRLKRAELRDLKTKVARDKALQELNGVFGQVSLEEMKKTGLPLKPLEATMTDSAAKEFNSLCNRYGLLRAGVQSKELNERNERQYIYTIFEKDGPIYEKIMDRLNAEMAAKKRDEMIEELKNLGEKRTPEQERELQTLFKERGDEVQEICDKMNDQTTEDIIQKAITGEPEKDMTFDEILNEKTGRHIDKDIFSVLVDASDPSKFILCHGQQDVSPKGEEYIKTDYVVFKNDKIVMDTHDGRFEGRTKNYWPNQKALMKEAGDFGDRMLKFPNVEAAQVWRDRVEKENAAELGLMDKEKSDSTSAPTYAKSMEKAFAFGRSRVEYLPKEQEEISNEIDSNQLSDSSNAKYDFKAVQAKLEDTLHENGFKIGEDRQVVYEDGTELPNETTSLSKSEQMKLAEAKVVGEQIDVYNDLEEIEKERALAQSKVTCMDLDGVSKETEEYKNAVADVDYLNNVYKECEAKAEELIDLRKEINGAQNEQSMREERGANRETKLDKELGKDPNLTTEMPGEEIGDSERLHRTVDNRERPNYKQWTNEKIAERRKAREAEETAAQRTDPVKETGKSKTSQNKDRD